MGTAASQSLRQLQIVTRTLETMRLRGLMGLMMPAFRNPPDRLQHLGEMIVNQLSTPRLPEDTAPSEQSGDSI